MSATGFAAVNADELIVHNKYNVDEENSHIKLVENPDPEEFMKLVYLCPAGLYRMDEDGSMRFDYAGCLECGTCRIVGEGTILEKWENPQPTMGVEYRFG